MRTHLLKVILPVLMITSLIPAPAFADIETILKQIELNTRYTLDSLIREGGVILWLHKINATIEAQTKTLDQNDGPSEISKLLRQGEDGQSGFIQINQLMSATLQPNIPILKNLTNDLFGSSNLSVSEVNGTGKIALQFRPEDIPYANDLSYSTLLGLAPIAEPREHPDTIDSRYNYIKNASGVNIYHRMPGEWMTNGKESSRQRYQSYYNTVMAVESFNFYILSQKYTEGNKLSKIQEKLYNQATNVSKWFAEIGGETISWVFRQSLLYQSQIYLLLLESVQLQKQAIIAQVMNNSLLINNNITNENILATSAEGTMPTA